MKFKVGDRVRVRKDLKYNSFYGGVRVNSEMVNNKGKILTIIETYDGTYLMEGSAWFWTDEMFENKEEYTYEDLRKSPIGTKVIFENGIVLIKLAERYYSENREAGIIRNSYDLKNLKDNFGNSGKIIKIEEPEYKTVYEYKPEILDETEKRYLRGVIRPFRDKVEYIQKYKSIMYEDSDYINIYIEGSHSITLPYFESNTMYKNMETDKKYTLEELGL